LNIEANKIAEITHVSRPCINRILKALRQRIAEFCETDSPFDKSEIEIVESFFSARKVRI